MHILIFFIILIILILVHEFGHFIVAKKSGVRVDEFGIGFPPKLYGKKCGETEYTLNALPIGGFVRIWGEDPTEENSSGPGSERSFVSQPKYIQAAILVAGVTMNVLLAYVLFVAAFMMGMPTNDFAIPEDGSPIVDVENVQLLVTQTFPDTPAGEALKSGDYITAVTRGDTQLSSDEILLPAIVSSFISESNGETLTFTIVRRNEVHTINLVPQKGILEEDRERYAAGFAMDLIGTKKLPFGDAVVEAGVRTGTGLQDILVGLGTLVSQMFKGTADYTQVAGPIGIVGLVGDAASLGITWLLMFTAFISLNLAVINLLPIPALDGGRLVFVLIESITRRPIKPIWATRTNQIGFLFLLTLMALVTFNDVWNLL